MVEKEIEVNFCDAFLEKVSNEQGFENKVRYLLKDFFYNEGWASKTNPKHMKEGYNAQHTYNNNDIDHFIEDFTRWALREFKIITKDWKNYKPNIRRQKSGIKTKDRKTDKE